MFVADDDDDDEDDDDDDDDDNNNPQTFPHCISVLRHYPHNSQIKNLQQPPLKQTPSKSYPIHSSDSKC